MPKDTGLYAADIEPATSIALCLSGGGYRSALFHLGALRRLNEVGALSRVTLVSSVSGGSILAGHLATHIQPWPTEGTQFTGWAEAERSFLRFIKRNIRTWPVLKRYLIPWNWLRPSTQVCALEQSYEKWLTGLKMNELPDHPTFVFCATDMVHGVSWVFQKSRVGSYKSGYLKPAPTWPLARAIAASSCFPPVFNPMPVPAPTKAAQSIASTIGLSDGGLYDNLGLEPAARAQITLASDGGAPFVAGVPHGLFGRVKAYLSVMSKQAGALRKRHLIEKLNRDEYDGTYWGIDSAPERYVKDLPHNQRSPPPVGYSKQLAVDRIAAIRTDLDPFSDAEAAVLVNHGYCLCDVALRAYAPSLIMIPAPLNTPFPEWMDEQKVDRALRYSNTRFKVMRWARRLWDRVTGVKQ